MKNIMFLILIGIMCFFNTISWAQAPEKFNYQAVIRDNAGELIVEQNVGVKLSILDETATGTVLYSETHIVSTNAYGQLSVKVGNGVVASGTFSDINWASGDKYLKIELDATGGISYTALGEVQLLSVPYALFAKNVENKDDADADATNEIQDLELTDNTLTITNNTSATPINLLAYTGTNTDEQTLSLSGTNLSITGGNTIDVSSLQDGVDDADNNPANELQNLTLDGDTLKISNGNGVIFPYDSSRWALNGNDMYYNTGKVGIGVSAPNSKLEVMADASFTDNDTLFAVKDKNGNVVFAVFPDGAKVYVNEGAKGTVGGFAVSGRGVGKGVVEDYMVITPDSARIYIDTVSSKGKVGGFAVSGRGVGKGVSNNIFLATVDSTRIYVDESSTKGKVGGFAVSGRGVGKGVSNNIFLATVDSTRVYVDGSSTKGKVGGFAVSGRGVGKTSAIKDFFNISANATAEVINNESRIMWYPEKSALLAGELYIPDPDSVGEFSISLGYRNSAIGDWSQAMGSGSIARGPYSTAIGVEAVADTNSFAFGVKAQATGFNSYAFGSVSIDSLGNETGNVTKATGDYSFAFGLGSQSTATGSFVLGTNCESSGNFSAALGYLSVASGWGSIAIGAKNTVSGDNAIAMGTNNRAEGTAAVAFGLSNNATGIQAVAAGNGNTASGASAVAIGTGNNASGDNSFSGGRYNVCTNVGSSAFGTSNISSNSNSFAIGESTQATGSRSFAAGYESVASGTQSVALGYQTNSSYSGTLTTGRATTATGAYSVAAGYYSTAQAYGSLVIGRWNEISGTTTSWISSDALFVAGNGSSGSDRSNAMILYKNGNMEIAGSLTANGTTYPSDIRLKENIVELTNVLQEIGTIRSVYFDFIDKTKYPDKKQIGFIAQEIQSVFPEIVKENNKGFLSVDYSKMTVILLQAVKEQQKIIGQEQQKNVELQKQIDDINKRLLLLEK